MQLYTVTKHQFAGNISAKSIIASGITKTIANHLISKSPKTISNTFYFVSLDK